MKYPFSAEDRLINPCTYMYTPFEGYEFIKSYSSSRLEVINSIWKSLSNTVVCHGQYEDILNCGIESVIGISDDNETREQTGRFYSIFSKNPSRLAGDGSKAGRGGLSGNKVALASLDVNQNIVTSELLTALLGALFYERGYQLSVKSWLDRLVQSFEVHKKIFDVYNPGFKKSDGRSDRLDLYALFALTTAIFYQRESSLKYLNVLLKVNDTLCSVYDRLKENPELGGLTYLAVICELIYVRRLRLWKGINDDIG